MKIICKKGINILFGCGIEPDTKQKQDEVLLLSMLIIPEMQPYLVVG
jgi:hypothetical protein